MQRTGLTPDGGAGKNMFVPGCQGVKNLAGKTGESSGSQQQSGTMLAEEGFLEEAFLGAVTRNQAWKGRGGEMEQMQLRSILPAVTFRFLGQSGWARECPEGVPGRVSREEVSI